MSSITVTQAAMIAAIAMVVLIGFSLADNTALLRDEPALFLLGSTVPNVVWAGFFLVLSRRQALIRTAVWSTLVFALLLETVIVFIGFQRSVSYWTPFGNAHSLSGWLLRLGWVVFLIALAAAPLHPRTRQIALVLAIFSAPPAVSNAYDAWNSTVGFLLGDLPREAVWRALFTPAIRTFYWLSQVLFLWTVWRNPETRDPLGATSARFAP